MDKHKDALYREANRDTIRQKQRADRKADPLRHRVYALRSAMKCRSAEFGMEFDEQYFTHELIEGWLRSTTHCACCHRSLSFSQSTGRDPKRTIPSADRIRSDRGYVEGNVALICWRCNYVKGPATAKELKGIVRWLSGVKQIQESVQSPFSSSWALYPKAPKKRRRSRTVKWPDGTRQLSILDYYPPDTVSTS